MYKLSVTNVGWKPRLGKILVSDWLSLLSVLCVFICFAVNNLYWQLVIGPQAKTEFYYKTDPFLHDAKFCFLFDKIDLFLWADAKLFDFFSRFYSNFYAFFLCSDFLFFDFLPHSFTQFLFFLRRCDISIKWSTRIKRCLIT